MARWSPLPLQKAYWPISPMRVPQAATWTALHQAAGKSPSTYPSSRQQSRVTKTVGLFFRAASLLEILPANGAALLPPPPILLPCILHRIESKATPVAQGSSLCTNHQGAPSQRGGAHVQKAAGHHRRFHSDFHASDPGYRLFPARRAKTPGLVWWVRLFGNHGILHHADAHSRAARVSRDLRGVFRQFGTYLWIPDAHRRLRHRHEHARRRAHGAHAYSVLYELDRQPEGRGI